MKNFNTKILVVIFILSIILIAKVNATTDVIGSAVTTGTGGDQPYAWNITASASGTLATIGVNVVVNGSEQIAVAIYTESGGKPDMLLGNSTLQQAINGWDDLSIPGSITISMGTTYWLVAYLNSSTYVERGPPNQVLCYNNDGQGSWGSSFQAQPGYGCTGVIEPYNYRMIYSMTTNLTSVTISPISSQISLGQSQAYLATVVGGTIPLTYNWSVYNSMGSLVFNELYTNNNFYGNTLIFTPSNLDTYTVNVAVTDQEPITVNSTKSTLNVIPINDIVCNAGVPTNVLPGSIFQNTNTSQLMIFSDSHNPLEGYYSPNANVFEVINESADSINNHSTTLVFPSGYIGEYNFTIPVNFHCIWLASSQQSNTVSTGSQLLINQQLYVFTETHILFILLFCTAIVFIIIFLIYLPQDLKKQSLRPLFILLFAIGLWIATLPAMLSPENILSVSYPSYNVIQGNTITQFPAYTANAISKLQVGSYNAFFYIWLTFLGFMFFLLLLWYILLLSARTGELTKKGGQVIEDFSKRFRK